MTEQQENTIPKGASPPSTSPGEGCPVPPQLSEIPDAPKVETLGIPAHKLNEIKAKGEKAKRVAADKHEESYQKAQDALDEAETKHTLANKKYETSKSLLSKKITNANLDLWSDFQQQQAGSSGTSVLPQDLGIYIAQLQLGLSEKRLDFQKEMQKLEQAKSLADTDWTKAQDDAKYARCVADAEKEKAEKAAELDYWKAISQALKD